MSDGDAHFWQPWRFLDWGLVVSGSLILAAVGEPRGWEWAWDAVAGILIVTQQVLAARRQWKSEQKVRRVRDLAEETQARLNLATGTLIKPIAHLLGRIALAEPNKRVGLLGQLSMRIVESAAQMCGPDLARATFFFLADGELRPECWVGRVDEPRTVFRNDDPRGRQALELLRSHQMLYLDDIQRPEGTDVIVRQDAPYRTFITVPVFAGNRDFGMLSVDAPEPGSLDGDEPIVQALAQLLGAGLALG